MAVYLTHEDKLKAKQNQRDRKLQALINSKMIEYGITIETIERSLGISQSATYRRLRNPSDRLSIKEFSILVEVLHISNEEICSIVR